MSRPPRPHATPMMGADSILTKLYVNCSSLFVTVFFYCLLFEFSVQILHLLKNLMSCNFAYMFSASFSFVPSWFFCFCLFFSISLRCNYHSEKWLMPLTLSRRQCRVQHRASQNQQQCQEFGIISVVTRILRCLFYS